MTQEEQEQADREVIDLAQAAGIETHWIDAHGSPQTVSVPALRAILRALELSCDTPQECQDSAARFATFQRDNALPPLITGRTNTALQLPFVEALFGATYQIRLEHGELIEGRFHEDRSQPLTLEAIGVYGYHKLIAGGKEVTLAIAPPCCFSVEDALKDNENDNERDNKHDSSNNDARIWGLASQLYGLQREGDGGIGDFTGLTMLIRAAARKGASLLTISPVHAMFSADPNRFSPYSPSSRLFLNILHIDAAAIAGEAVVQEALAAISGDAAAKWQALEKLPLLDWPEAAQLKMGVLRFLYERLMADAAQGPQRAAFDAFCEKGGDALKAHGCFETLHAMMRTQGLSGGWQQWPIEYHDPQGEAVRQFTESHAKEIGFHLFLQWQAALGLSNAQRTAREAGMVIGVVTDLAIGADNGGSQAWTRQGEIVNGLTVGAPPDLLSPHGQGWGLGAFSPHAMQAKGYRAYIEMLRAAFAHAGGVRIDHVLGMRRLWLLPDGAAPSQGAYLRYPLEDMLCLAALESWRHRAIVIGEDLGTVPDGFRDVLAQQKLLGIQVLWFQSDWQRFFSPSEWRHDAIGVSGTHDLPTIAGWWSGHDIGWRERLGMLQPGESVHAAIVQREIERRRLWDALCAAGCAHGDMPPADADSAPIEQIIAFLNQTNASIAVVPLEDILGLLEQPNFPGTVADHPNWQRRMPLPAQCLLDDAHVTSRLAQLQERSPVFKFKHFSRSFSNHCTRSNMSIARATARLQLHRGFTFDDATAVADYYAALGISHIYTSPILAARPGSMHGYDIVDPTRVNPELGGEPGLRRLVSRLRDLGMGLIVDIVPNHMGVGINNPWWQHVLEWGEASPYAHWFDIDWKALDPAVYGKVLLPVLGKQYGETLQQNEIRLHFDAKQGKIFIACHENHFPLAPTDYINVLDRVDAPVLAAVAQAFRKIDLSSPAEAQTQADNAFIVLRETGCTKEGATAIGQALKHFSAADPGGHAALHALLERQHYRLAWWRCGADQLNWRRFFEVSDLAGMRVERDDVFDATHALIFRFYCEGLIDGLRVDHIDGLADPKAYCVKLRSRLETLAHERNAALTESETYLVVEKILGADEHLCLDWKISGTTGYDFMDQVGALLHDPRGELPLTELWQKTSETTGDFELEVRAARRQLLTANLSGEFDATVRALLAVARSSIETRDYSMPSIRRVLLQLLLNFPVYRTYADADGRTAADQEVFDRAMQKTSLQLRSADHALLKTLGEWLNGPGEDVSLQTLRQNAITRFQQLTPPLSAKSVEDTAFYRYGRLLSRNEVGSNPGKFSMSIEDFHKACEQRSLTFPHAMLATATHDHKRGEDLRARLAVLSELPQEWIEMVHHWQALNTTLRVTLPATDSRTEIIAPSAADELMLYQMLVGAWPIGLNAGDVQGIDAFSKRIAQWQAKALREAKQDSDWLEPDIDYEEACATFLSKILAPQGNEEFLNQLLAWVAKISPVGALNSLTQTLLRLTAPGVPDLYQGSDEWDFSLVDPDNRRPVDYDIRRAHLKQTQEQSWSESVNDPAFWRTGRIKQTLIAETLKLRAQQAELFSSGAYKALEVQGPCADKVVAFMRSHAERHLIVVAPKFCASMDINADTLTIKPEQWQDTAVLLPEEFSAQLCNQLTQEKVGLSNGRLNLSELLRNSPVALLYGTSRNPNQSD